MQLNLTPNPRTVGEALTEAWSWRANFALWIAILARGWSPCDIAPSMQARAHKMANRLAPKTLIPPKSEINPPKRTKKNGDNQETFLQKPSPINQLTKQKHRQICGEKKNV